MQAAQPIVEEINQYLTQLNADQQKAVLTVVKTFAAGQPQESKCQLLRKNIHHFADLLPNWDTYNADPISEIATTKAIQAVDFLNKEELLSGNLEVNVFPMRNGGVQFEFDSGSISAELEIAPDGQQIFVLFDTRGNTVETKHVTDLSQLTTYLAAAQYA